VCGNAGLYSVIFVSEQAGCFALAQRTKQAYNNRKKQLTFCFSEERDPPNGAKNRCIYSIAESALLERTDCRGIHSAVAAASTYAASSLFSFAGSCFTAGLLLCSHAAGTFAVVR